MGGWKLGPQKSDLPARLPALLEPAAKLAGCEAWLSRAAHHGDYTVELLKEHNREHEDHDAALAQTFVFAKLIEVALLDRLTAQRRKDYDSSLEGKDPRRPALSQWRLVKMARVEFQTAIWFAFVAAYVDRAQRIDALDALREGPRKRKDASRLIAAVHRRLNSDEPALVPLVA